MARDIMPFGFDEFFDDLENFFEKEMERLKRLFRSDLREFKDKGEEFLPVMEVGRNYELREDDKNIYLTFELPGVDKEDINLSITENEVEVKVEKKKEEEKKEKEMYRRVSRYSGYYNAIRLPKEIDVNKVKATYKNGVLDIVLPKIKPDKSKKRINIE